MTHLDSYTNPMRICFCLLPLLCLVGCVTVPIEATTSKGEHFYGSAKANAFSPNGTFMLYSPNGVTAQGTYPVSPNEVALPVKFSLSDGRSGNGVLLRQGSLNRGKGSGFTSDGTKFEFRFGDLIEGTPQLIRVLPPRPGDSLTE